MIKVMGFIWVADSSGRIAVGVIRIISPDGYGERLWGLGVKYRIKFVERHRVR